MSTTIEAARPLVAVGEIIGMLGIPAIGLLLLILGLVQRSRSTPTPPRTPTLDAPHYPYPPQAPPGYPQQGYPPQQFGYPPAPPAAYPGSGPYANPYAYPPPPPVTKRGTALIVIGAILLAFGLLGVVGRLALHSAGSSSVVVITPSAGAPTGAPDASSQPGADLKVGQCITSAQFQSRTLLQGSDCSDTMSTYLLASRGDGDTNCADGKRDDSVYSVLKNDSVTMCFEPNMQAGKCYSAPSGSTAFFTYSALCGTGDFKVTQRVDGTTDLSKCPNDTKAVAFPDPAVLYCVSRPLP